MCVYLPSCIYLVVKYRKRAALGSCCPVSITLLIQIGFKFINNFCTHRLLIKSIPCCYTSIWKTAFLCLSYRRSSSISYYSLLSQSYHALLSLLCPVSPILLASCIMLLATIVGPLSLFFPVLLVPISLVFLYKYDLSEFLVV